MDFASHDRPKICYRIVVGSRDRLAGHLFFLTPFAPHANLVTSHRDDVAGLPVHFHILAVEWPIPGGLQNGLGLRIGQNNRCFIIYVRIHIRLDPLRHGGDCLRPLAVH